MAPLFSSHSRFFAVVCVILQCCIITNALSPSDQTGLLHLIGNITNWPGDWQASDVNNACSWTGIGCDGAESRVTSITFRRQENITSDAGRMKGPLPDTFHNFPSMISFELSLTQLYGTIPPSLISTHPTIASIVLEDSYLTGTLPEVLSPELIELQLTKNLFHGPLPAAIANITRQLNLAGNRFECPFPNVTLLVNPDDCTLKENRFTLADNGKYCGTVSTSVGPCVMSPQLVELNPTALIPPSSVAAELAATQVKARIFLEDNYVVFYFRDKITGEFIEDEYFAIQFLHFAPERGLPGNAYPGVFVEFTTLRQVGYGYEIDGYFETGYNFTVLVDVTEDQSAIKVGWKIRGKGELMQKPIFSIVAFLRSPLHEGSAGFPCVDGYTDFFTHELEYQLEGFRVLDCVGTHTNYSVTTKTIDGNYVIDYRAKSLRADFSIIWNGTVLLDGVPLSFRTSSSTYFTKGGTIAMKAHRAGTEFGLPGFPAVPLQEQWLGLLYGLRYGPFANELLYDPEIRLNDIFTLNGDNTSIIVGAVVGSVAGLAVVGFIGALALSNTFRHKVLPFSKRAAYEVTDAGGPSGEQVASTEVPSWKSAKSTHNTITNA